MIKRFTLSLIVALLVGWGIASAQVVEIPDPKLQRDIREKLGLADDATITVADMAQLTNLRSVDGEITSLTGLEHAVNLWFLNLSGTKISDLTPLTGLKKLGSLHIYANSISDITPLAELTGLTFLNLTSNNLVDISSLANLKKLEKLFLGSNDIVDITPLTGLTVLPSEIRATC